MFLKCQLLSHDVALQVKSKLEGFHAKNGGNFKAIVDFFSKIAGSDLPPEMIAAMLSVPVDSAVPEQNLLDCFQQGIDPETDTVEKLAEHIDSC